MTSYTVWVGGIPIVENIEYSTALEMYYTFKDEGYTDTIIEEHNK